MASTKMIDIRRGMVLNMNGTLFYCLDRDLNTPGNWRAILYLKLKNLTTGSITESDVLQAVIEVTLDRIAQVASDSSTTDPPPTR